MMRIAQRNPFFHFLLLQWTPSSKLLGFIYFFNGMSTSVEYLISKSGFNSVTGVRTQSIALVTTCARVNLFHLGYRPGQGKRTTNGTLHLITSTGRAKLITLFNYFPHTHRSIGDTVCVSLTKWTYVNLREILLYIYIYIYIYIY